MKKDINKVIEKLNPNIEAHAEQASKVFSALKYKHEVFEGTAMEFSKEICKDIYIDLLKEVIEKQLIITQKYGLIVMAIPCKTKKKTMFNIQFGVIFPGVD